MIQALFEEQRVINIFNQVLGMPDSNTELSYFQTIQHKIKNSKSQEFYVPVLGIQGTGKSSFLNALLMDELILPVDADETTCVSVEIRYGQSGAPIMVHFEHEPPISISNPEQLVQYVHNDYNPGNEKKVTFIQVFKDHPLLKNGVVFVDLPGVGSLTQSNIKMTMDYIEKLSAAIFMLRTVPPITKQEANFLKAVWPKLSKAWFIQNQWNDESQQEVEDGKAHNIRVLEDIRDAHRMNQPIDVRIINVYAALKAQLTNDSQLRETSGLSAFEHLFAAISTSWSTALDDELRSIQQKAFADVKTVLQKQIELFEKGPHEHYEWLRREEEELEKMVEENNKVLRSLEKMLSEEEARLSTFVRTIVRDGKENLRADMQRIVKGNVVDGERLSNAFQDCQKDVTDDILEAYLEEMTDLKLRVEESFHHLQVRDMDGSFDSFENFSKKEQIKFEKGIQSVFTLGTGAAVLLLSSNPFGWAALGATVLFTTIAGMIGKKAKQVTQESRQRNTMDQLEEPINNFARKIDKSLTEQLSSYIFSIRGTAKKIKVEQERILEDTYEEQRRIRFVEMDEYKVQQQKLMDDLAYIKSLELK
ncbi:dynamin family protein [Bacillus sp. T3]|uniref:dynamin family protein n=1 Tax=Bacillus sp. T3 TaxID=467262 RepID=UPI0029824B29|nr:dynamin family protein [Bacillus sp. T3]